VEYQNKIFVDIAKNLQEISKVIFIKLITDCENDSKFLSLSFEFVVLFLGGTEWEGKQLRMCLV